MCILSCCTAFASNCVFLLLGKNKESISQKLDDIIAKQKSLEIKGKASDTSPNHAKRAPMHSQRNVKARHKKLGTHGKAEHLSTSKQKHPRFPDRRTEDIRTNQKSMAAKPSHPTSQPNTWPTPQLRKHPASIPEPRQRTRPNILSHTKSQPLAKDQGWYYEREDTTVCAQHQKKT